MNPMFVSTGGALSLIQCLQQRTRLDQRCAVVSLSDTIQYLKHRTRANQRCGIAFLSCSLRYLQERTRSDQPCTMQYIRKMHCSLCFDCTIITSELESNGRYSSHWKIRTQFRIMLWLRFHNDVAKSKFFATPLVLVTRHILLCKDHPSSSPQQPPPSILVIITTTTIIHHHQNNPSSSLHVIHSFARRTSESPCDPECCLP